jgi:hypothetical protein
VDNLVSNDVTSNNVYVENIVWQFICLFQHHFVLAAERRTLGRYLKPPKSLYFNQKSNYVFLDEGTNYVFLNAY